MANIHVHQRKTFGASATALRTDHDFTTLDIQRGDTSLSLFFNHDEEGAEQLHELLIGVMDAWKQVDAGYREEQEYQAQTFEEKSQGLVNSIHEAA